MGMMSIGMGFVSMAAGGAILGFGVDYFAGTKPVGLLVGVVVGVVSGGWRMVKAVSAPTPARRTPGTVARSAPTRPERDRVGSASGGTSASSSGGSSGGGSQGRESR
jgi:hypothetical protein